MKLSSGRVILENDYSMVARAIGLRYNRSRWHNVYKEIIEYLGGMVYKVMKMERDGNVFAHEIAKLTRVDGVEMQWDFFSTPHLVANSCRLYSKLYYF